MKTNNIDIMNKKYVIWGTGIDAVRLYYKIDNCNDVIFFIDDKNAIQGKFLGKDVYRFAQVVDYIKNYTILIAAPRSYEIIKKKCIDNNLSEFNSFFPSEMLYKKMVILHGNCHMNVIREYLKSSIKFNEKYFIYDIPRVCESTFGEIEESVLKNCDVYIHQDIRPENEFGYKLSDEYIKKHIGNHCIDITVPNLFGYGKMFFPQFFWNKNNMSLGAGNNKNGLFPYGNTIIEKALEQGLSEAEIYSLTQKDVFEENYIKELFYNGCQKIKNREKSWDIKCYEFILDNYKTHKLFYDQGHPTNYVIEYIAKEILKLLGLGEDEIYSTVQMDDYEEFVFDCVRKTLGIVWKENELRCSNSGKKLTSVMDIKEYISEYIWWKKLSEKSL